MLVRSLFPKNSLIWPVHHIDLLQQPTTTSLRCVQIKYGNRTEPDGDEKARNQEERKEEAQI